VNVSADLFQTNQLERIPIEDAEVYYLPELPLLASATSILRSLIDETPWRAESIVVWGKKFLQPRLIAWYGDPGSVYTYSGIHLDPMPWTKTLQDIKVKVEAVSEESFNSVLLNYYRDHRDSMGLHSDDEPELGKRPIIASLSLGEERTLIFKHKSRLDLKSVRIRLGSGSLLLMKGETQRHWKHGIDKERGPCGPRVNLTFRRIQM
jgi:alkylated DNA repair dioxygenase AlkB